MDFSTPKKINWTYIIIVIIVVVITWGPILWYITKVEPDLPLFELTEIIEPEKRTEIIKYIPTTIPDEEYEASCWVNSSAAYRKDAWRCIVDNRGIEDPCFVLKENETLVCSPNPVTDYKGILIKLKDPSPEPNIPEDRFGESWAWLIELEDGSVCKFITGATLIVNGKRINYACDKESKYILGDLKIDSYWQTERVALKIVEGEQIIESSELVNIKTAYQ